MEHVEDKTDPDADELRPDQPAASRPGRRIDATRLLAGSVAVLVVAALIFSAIEMASQHAKIGRLESQESLRSSALTAATTYGGYLSSYNYANLDGPTAPWTEVDQHSTPSFQKDFDSTKANLRSLVTDYKATASGKVVAAAINSVSSTRAVALLFIDQTVTNTAEKPGTTTQPLRVELVMLRQGGKWLIDQLEVPS